MDKLRQNFEKHIKHLCLECGSRHCGSVGERLAADYIEAQFREMGYETVREEYPTFGWEYRSFSLFNVTKNREVPSAVAGFYSNPVDITDKFVFITLEDLERLDGMDLRGKLLFVKIGKLSGKSCVTGLNGIAERLDAAGVAGAVFMSAGHVATHPSTKMPRSPFMKQMGVATVSLDGAMDIAKNPSDVYRLVIDAKKFETVSCNVIARHHGKGKKAVIGAHYDTAPNIQGADDNASGTALVIELARLMKDKYTDYAFDFCAFSAEEYIPDLLPPGSGDYVKRHKDENIKWYLNADCIGGYLGSRLLSITHKEKLPELTVDAALIDEKRLAGDDKAFSLAGIPTVWLDCIDVFGLVHTEADNIDNISFDNMESYAKLYVDLFHRLASADYE